MKATPGHLCAFPSGTTDTDGMTMREWYAGMALQLVGALVGQGFAREGMIIDDQVVINKATEKDLAAMAFSIADAMLARAKEGQA